MQKKLLKSLALLFFSAMTVSMLLFSRQSSALALEGLNLWFQKMIPALLPFMILSGVLIGLNLSDSFAALFSPLLRPLFKLSDSCLYCMIIGFVCGFPMGARVCAQSYERGKISQEQASLLLAFCNNIGPVYFTGFVLPLFPVAHTGLVLTGMYGIPLLYGLFLRYTLFRGIPVTAGSISRRSKHTAPGQIQRREQPGELTAASLERSSTGAGRLFAQLNASILSGLDSITVLGGYMIFCNLLNLLPQLYLKDYPQLVTALGPLLEITSGLARLSPGQKLWAYIVLPFGGLSCIAQTYSCIRDTGLSLKEYTFHKVIQTMLTAALYSFFGNRF